MVKKSQMKMLYATLEFILGTDCFLLRIIVKNSR